ncbi:hypothetical protein SLE2022_017160 [Rubroshorea leprosula]
MSSRRVSLFACLLIFSFFYIWLFDAVGAASHTISQGQMIRPSETITSAGNIFELGFFYPGGSTNCYVGIWYKQVAEQTIVWVANRDLTLTGSSLFLTINKEGFLVIIDDRITYRVSDNSLSQNVSATLLDSGNLVLRNDNFDILWESFDNPSHTFLPGMKFGYSKKTGKVWSLKSWKDAQDPSLGSFEIKMDPKQPNEVFLVRGSEILWRSGVWNGKSAFVSIPEMRLNYIFNYSLIEDENETYFTYSLYDSSIFSRAILDVSGQVKQMSWLENTASWALFWAQPRVSERCDIFCGAFSFCSSYNMTCQCLHGFVPSKKQLQQDLRGVGCVRRTTLDCENSISMNKSQDRFLRMDDMTYPSPARRVVKIQDAKNCRLLCLDNCSCSAYAYNGSCLIWNGEILYLRQRPKMDPDRRTIYLKLAASEFQSPEGSKTFLWVIVTVVAITVLLLSAFCAMYHWRKRLRMRVTRGLITSEDILLFDVDKSITNSNGEIFGSENSNSGTGRRKDAWLPLFSFDSVSLATDNFSIENKLGEGGFGPVYKGKLLNGQQIAVKRLSRRSRQGLEELRNETMLIAKLQHRNLVRLLGCCLEQGEKILIYEYMPNKSLDLFLFGATTENSLGWATRVRIIEGIAQGLLYLHQYSRMRIIHRDLKASNVLLDGNMNPKISDFGLARMFGGDESQANTNHIVGTYGYMPPEYALGGLFSIKSDVFSFGVLLLEIISGRKNTGFYNSNSLHLLGHAWDLWTSGKSLELMDPSLRDVSSANQLLRYINIALLCVQESATERPTMSDVVSMLSNELTVLPSPKQPAFSNVRSVGNPNACLSSRGENCSVNEVTASVIEPR